jgi:tRNA(Arg) A34 adenosine deaminase TadA
MCKGAIIQNRIKNVVFELNKPIGEQLAAQLKSLRHEVRKKRFEAPGLQEGLFLRHPDYPNKK